MSWSNANLAGVKQVFSFTASQFLKNRANLLTFVILFCLCLCSAPLMGLLPSQTSELLPEQSGLSRVYLEDETGLSLSWQELAAQTPFYSATEFVPVGETPSLEENQVLARLTGDEQGYQVELLTPSQSPDQEELDALTAFFTRQLQLARLSQAGLTAQQVSLLEQGVTVQSSSWEEYSAPDPQEDSDTGYLAQLIYSVLVLMVSVFSVSYIIRAVVEEKSSKLVETLLLSIRPLALILGKVLAVMACVFGAFLALALGVGLSFAGTALLMPQLSLAGAGEFFSRLSLGWDTALVLLVSLALGYLTFALVAGLSGAGCSSTQELDGAMSFSVLLIMAGYLVGIFLTTLPQSGGFWTVFSALCPVLSVFCAPVQYFMGNLPFWLLFVSWLIQGAVVALLALLCAKVYQGLLLYRGERLSFGKILSMALGKGGVRP